jgi:hypothetical protein
MGFPAKKGNSQTEALEEENTNLQMYPNPTQGEFTLEWADQKNEDTQILIYNGTGMLIYEAHTAENLMQIDLSSKPAGLYLVTVQTGTKLFKEQIILR